MLTQIQNSSGAHIFKTYEDYREKLDGCLSQLDRPRSLLEKAISACFDDKEREQIKETAKTTLITMTNMAVLDLEDGKRGQALSQANEVFKYNRRLFHDMPMGKVIEKECVRIGVGTLNPPAAFTS